LLRLRGRWTSSGAQDRPVTGRELRSLAKAYRESGFNQLLANILDMDANEVKLVLLAAIVTLDMEVVDL
jgi:hypothetical protein